MSQMDIHTVLTWNVLSIELKLTVGEMLLGGHSTFGIGGTSFDFIRRSRDSLPDTEAL